MNATGIEYTPTSEQQDLIERFLVAFNSIEDYLRQQLKEPPETSFRQLVDRYGGKQPVWYQRTGSQLRSFADLRNALVHMRYGQKQYLSVPLPRVVERLEQICKSLTRPEKVIPKFQRNVHTLKSTDSLASVLRCIDKYAFSQIPIYDGERSFCGLLTENGITRWLAAHVANQLTLVEFDETAVEKILSQEESQSNCQFVSRRRTTIDVVGMFSRKPILEAVLITQDGKDNQDLLGIITRWDVQEYLM